MDFGRLISDIEKMKLNLYDFSVWTEEGIQTHRFCRCNNCNNSYSVAKAFTMTAIGLLWDDGKLEMSDTLSSIFPDYFRTARSAGWESATLEHAMTHRLGLERDSLDIDTQDMTKYPTQDYLELVFSTPLAACPGREYLYTDAAFYLLARAVERLAGETEDLFLYRRLLGNMNFHEIAWSRDPLGFPIGATGLYLGSQDMVKLGALYLQHGIYDGKRLLSEEWVKKALENAYEFAPIGSHGLIGKGGMRGQCLCFSEEKRFTAAWHGCQDDGGMDRLTEYLDAWTD